MSRPISYGLIGAGGFGASHLKTLRNFEQTGDVRLAAVCDPAIHRLGEVTAELTAQGVRLYESHDEMLAREDGLEAVTIAAPIPFHDRIAKACLQKSLFIYLEKPPVPLLEQWHSLAEADPENRIAICFQLIEYDWSRRLKERLVDGSFGALREVRGSACWPRGDAYYRRASWAGRLFLGEEPVFDGPATNALAHLIHQIMFLAADTRDGFAIPKTVDAALFRAQPVESYDTAFVGGEFPGGARFQVGVTHACETQLPYEIHVVGSDAWVKTTESGEVVESTPGLLGLPPVQEYPFERAYRNFLDYARGRIARPSTLLRDTLGYLATTNGMLMASGGIHSIPSEYVHRNSEQGLYSVPNLPETIVDFLKTGQLPSSTGAFFRDRQGGPISTEPLCLPGFAGLAPLLKRETAKTI